MKISFVSIVLLLGSLTLSSKVISQNKLTNLTGPYLGQKPPGLTPEVFAPGIISTKGWEYGVVFAPSLNEVYFVREVDLDTKPNQNKNLWFSKIRIIDGWNVFWGREEEPQLYQLMEEKCILAEVIKNALNPVGLFLKDLAQTLKTSELCE